mgnify:CR=1 FL=1
MGSKFDWGAPDRDMTGDSAANDFVVKTSHGTIRLSVDSREIESGGFPDPWTAATGNGAIASAGGIDIDPYKAGSQRAGLRIWLGHPGAGAYHGKGATEEEEEIHIVHKGSKIGENCE